MNTSRSELERTKRVDLAPFLRSRATFEGLLTGYVRKRGYYVLLLLKDIQITPAGQMDHAWVLLDHESWKRLYPGERYLFSAFVAEYRRSDGSFDYGFGDTRVIWD